MRGQNLTPLLKLINYQFNNQGLLINALTHRSHGAINNERMEFLGDSILNFVIAEALFEKFEDCTEGELSRLRAFLVKGETLAQISRELNLGEYLQLGAGELKSGGFRRDSILADCFEAMLAAIYMDGGFESCKEVIKLLYQPRLSDRTVFENLKDPKTLLQEWLQGRKLELPDYSLVSVTGAQHNQKFEVECVVKSQSLKSLGKGTTRRKAEKSAAESMLQLLKKTSIK